jgi:hypothetical protein
VADQVYSVEAVARQVIDQCRREIAAAVIQLEAAKEILKGSQWLLARWHERRQADAVSGGIRLPAYDVARAGMFLSVEPEAPRRRGRKRRFKIDVPSDRRNRPRSASG